MTTDTGPLRRRPPTPGDLSAELRTVLTAAGLPCADPDAERVSAVGLLITDEEGGGSAVEWFVSQTARAAAASEQTMGVPYGTGVLLHGEARRHIHNAVYGLLEALGYACEWTGSLTVRVKAERRQEPTTLAADVHRIVAEWGQLQQLAAASEARGSDRDEPGDNERLEQQAD